MHFTEAGPMRRRRSALRDGRAERLSRRVRLLGLQSRQAANILTRAPARACEWFECVG